MKTIESTKDDNLIIAIIAFCEDKTKENWAKIFEAKKSLLLDQRLEILEKYFKHLTGKELNSEPISGKIIAHELGMDAELDKFEEFEKFLKSSRPK